MINFNIAFVIDFFIRLLSGERFRKATPKEKQSYTLGLNIVALMTLCLPIFSTVLKEGSNLKLWLAVMAALLPSVLSSFWLIERLSAGFLAKLSITVLLVAAILAMLNMFSIYSGFTVINAVIGLSLYFGVCGIGIIVRYKNH